jgi:hypothetical protein
MNVKTHIELFDYQVPHHLQRFFQWFEDFSRFVEEYEREREGAENDGCCCDTSCKDTWPGGCRSEGILAEGGSKWGRIRQMAITSHQIRTLQEANLVKVSEDGLFARPWYAALEDAQ